MGKRNKILQKVVEVVDSSTGEVVTQSKSYSIKVNADNFFITYIDSMASFYNLKSAVDMKVLARFCEKAEFNTGKVLLPSPVRNELCEFLKISSQQLTNSISNLKEIGLVTGERGYYQISPQVYWKGTSEARRNILANGGVSMNLTFELSE